MSRACAQKTSLKITNAYAGHCELQTGRTRHCCSGVAHSSPTWHAGLLLVVRELALPCAWPVACGILLVTPLCGPQLLLSRAWTWMPPLGEPGLCQSKVRWWTTRAVSKTGFVLLKLFGEGFRVTVCPTHEGRNVTYSLTDWRYLNSCLGGPAAPPASL